MPETCGHQCSKLRQGLCRACLEENQLIIKNQPKQMQPVPKIEIKSYTLRGENGEWLGQVLLTSDGMFSSVTDYGNLSYAWRSFGEKDFRKFLTELNVGYFATKLFTGMSYILHSRKCEQACNRFAEKVLPPLQKILNEEMSNGVSW